MRSFRLGGSGRVLPLAKVGANLVTLGCTASRSACAQLVSETIKMRTLPSVVLKQYRIKCGPDCNWSLCIGVASGQ
jgi:hypothetical protein